MGQRNFLKKIEGRRGKRSRKIWKNEIWARKIRDEEFKLANRGNDSVRVKTVKRTGRYEYNICILKAQLD